MMVTEAHRRRASEQQRYHDRAGAPRASRAGRCRALPGGGARLARAGTTRPAVRRSALVGVFAVLLATCAVWVQGGGGRAGSDPLAAPGTGRTASAAAHVWVVQPGDTIWAIARHLEPNGDVRPLVDRLSHEVHGRALQVGQRLVVP
jgi:LysM domain